MHLEAGNCMLLLFEMEQHFLSTFNAEQLPGYSTDNGRGTLLVRTLFAWHEVPYDELAHCGTKIAFDRG